MERKEGRGTRPGAPTKEQGGIYKESAEDTPCASPIEQKLSDKLSPTPAGEKKIEKGGILSKMREEIGNRRATSDCILPKIIFSPFDIGGMLRDGTITEEQAQELKQEWLENLKTLNRQELEDQLEGLERFKREDFPREPKKWQTQQAELLEYELEAIREQLRQRGG
jgi:hypothetical protein